VREERVEIVVRDGAGRFGQRRRLVAIRAVDGDDLDAGNRLRRARRACADPARAEDPDAHVGGSEPPLRQRLDPDVPVPDRVAVVLDEDVPLLGLAEPRDVLELALAIAALSSGESSSYCSTFLRSASARRACP
jgi:hypothetical protein